MSERSQQVKLAYSTLGCPGWAIEQVVDAAVRSGYAGVELRLLDGEVIDPIADRQKLDRAVHMLRERDVEVCALDTSCRFNLSDAQQRERQIADLLSWIPVAQELNVPILRVFGGAAPARASDDDGTRWVADALREAAPAAERAGVTVALETHDAFSSARRVAAVLDAVGSANVGAIWDSHHSYRVGETPDEVLRLLGDRIVHVHVKDARRTGPGYMDWQLVLLGEGEVPVRQQLDALSRHGYDGWVSVEWEKKWHPELPEPEVALPQHMAVLKEMLGA